jgi:hypothetical protein
MTENNKGDLHNDNLSNEEEFVDIQSGLVMNRNEFNQRIQKGQYPGYYVGTDLNGQLTDDLEEG